MLSKIAILWVVFAAIMGVALGGSIVSTYLAPPRPAIAQEISSVSSWCCGEGSVARRRFRDYQALLAAIIALAAALWAGRPVYKQLSEIRIQSAIQTHEMLRAYSQRLQVERRRTTILTRHSRSVGYALRSLLIPPSEGFAKNVAADIQTIYERLNQSIREFYEASTERWGDESVREARDLVQNSAYVHLRVLSSIAAKLTDFQDPRQPLRDWAIVHAAIASIQIEDKHQMLDQHCRTYINMIDAEEQRIAPLILRALGIVQSPVD